MIDANLRDYYKLNDFKPNKLQRIYYWFRDLRIRWATGQYGYGKIYKLLDVYYRIKFRE